MSKSKQKIKVSTTVANHTSMAVKNRILRTNRTSAENELGRVLIDSASETDQFYRVVNMDENIINQEDSGVTEVSIVIEYERLKINLP